MFKYRSTGRISGANDIPKDKSDYLGFKVSEQKLIYA